jgi:putative ABC transport system substrate-binding protein
MGEASPLVQLDDTLPGVTRVVMLFNAENPGHLAVVKDTVRASTQLGLQLETHGVRGANDLAEVFQAAARGRAQALLVQDDVTVTLLKQPIVDQAARQSLPVFAQYREFAEVGALVTFAHALADEYRLAASYVDRILKGSKPADLPIQQPTKFELIFNLKAAKARGLAIPPSVRMRADEVIE